MSTDEAILEEDLNSDRGVLVIKQTLAKDFLHALFKFFRLTETHDSENQLFDEVMGHVQRTVESWVNIPEFGRMDFALRGEQIFLNDVRIRPKPQDIRRLQFLIRFLRTRQIYGFNIGESPSSERLSNFLWTVTNVNAESSSLGVNELLRNLGLREFEVKSLDNIEVESGEEVRSATAKIYQQMLEFVSVCFRNLGKAKTMKALPIEQLFYELNAISESDFISFMCEQTNKEVDDPLPHIAVRTAFMLFGWCRALGLPVGVVAELAEAGLAHPLVSAHSKALSQKIGKNPSKIKTAMHNMKELSEVWHLSELQSLAVFEWSIPFNGKGTYEIRGHHCYQHFFSRMVRVAAIYNRLTVKTKEKEATLPADAVQELITKGHGCDQTLARLFVSWLGVYPLGSIVRLSSGELGQVCSTGVDVGQAGRPMIGVFQDKDGRVLEKPVVMDLGEIQEKVGVYRRGIDQAIDPKKCEVPQEKLRMLGTALSLATTG